MTTFIQCIETPFRNLGRLRESLPTKMNGLEWRQLLAMHSAAQRFNIRSNEHINEKILTELFNETTQKMHVSTDVVQATAVARFPKSLLP